MSMHLPERQVCMAPSPGQGADMAPSAKFAVIVAEESHASAWSGLEQVQPEYDILYASSSVLSLGTVGGRWIASAGCVTCALIPRSDSENADGTCRVIGISDLVRELLDAAAKLPLDGPEKGRDRLVLDLLPLEIARAASLPIGLPMPADPHLARKCTDFASMPHSDMSIDRWAADLSMSRRRFTSFFRRETGVAFKAWVRQACFAIAMVRLAKGDSLGLVAASCGYSSPAGLCTLIKRLSGAASVRRALRTAR